MKFYNIVYMGLVVWSHILYTKTEKIFAIGDSTIQFMFNDIVQNPDPVYWHHTFNTQYITASLDILESHVASFPAKTMHGTHTLSYDFLLCSPILSSISAVIFCFGLVDVLFHIKQQSFLQECSYEEIVKKLVFQYIEDIDKIRTMIPYNTIRWIIMGVLAPGRKCPFIQNDLETGVIINKLLNKHLQIYAEQYSMMFWNPFISFLDNNGFLLHKFTYGDFVHFEPSYNHLLLESLYTTLSTPTIISPCGM